MNRNTLKSGDSHAVFIKRQSETDWAEIVDMAQLLKLTEQLVDYEKHCTHSENTAQSGVMNPHDLWDVLVLLDINVPPSALHFLQPPVVTFFTYKMIGREDVCPESYKFMKELLSSACFEKETKFDELKVTDKAKKPKKTLNTVTAFIGTYDSSRMQRKQKQYLKEAKKVNETLRFIHEQINAPSDDLTLRVWYREENSDNNNEDKFLHLVNINCQDGESLDENNHDENISVMKKGVNNSVQKNPEYRLPLRWILLYLEILKLHISSNAEQCFVLHVEVLKIWKDKLKGKDEELHLVLQFFHYFGALFYFDSLDKYVFMDCRWLIESVRNLISGNVEYNRLNYGAKKALTQEGLLKCEMIQELDFEIASGHIELTLFIDLLVELKYIAPVNQHYFFPHILECHDRKEVSISDLYGSSPADPLFITFSPGVLHPCTFCYLVAYVLTKLPQWKHKKFDKQTRHTYNDLITFSYGPHYISFINETFYLKIQIFHKPDESNYDTNLPNSTLKLIKRALEEVCTSLCLPITTCKYGFLCSNCDGKSATHMMMVSHTEEETHTNKKNACCCKTNDQKHLSPQQAVWFSKVSIRRVIYMQFKLLNKAKVAMEQRMYNNSNMVEGLIAEGGWECYGIM